MLEKNFDFTLWNCYYLSRLLIFSLRNNNLAFWKIQNQFFEMLLQHYERMQHFLLQQNFFLKNCVHMAPGELLLQKYISSNQPTLSTCYHAQIQFIQALFYRKQTYVHVQEYFLALHLTNLLCKKINFFIIFQKNPLHFLFKYPVIINYL